MCGRFALAAPKAELITLFGLDDCVDFPVRYNIPPGTPPRQNSCRSDKMMNLGATRKRNGKVRRSIQETRGGEVIAAGER